jgi:hypothetical protein
MLEACANIDALSGVAACFWAAAAPSPCGEQGRALAVASLGRAGAAVTGWSRRRKIAHGPPPVTFAPYTRPHDAKRASRRDPSVAWPRVFPSREGRDESPLSNLTGFARRLALHGTGRRASLKATPASRRLGALRRQDEGYSVFLRARERGQGSRRVQRDAALPPYQRRPSLAHGARSAHIFAAFDGIPPENHRSPLALSKD